MNEIKAYMQRSRWLNIIFVIVLLGIAGGCAMPLIRPPEELSATPAAETTAATPITPVATTAEPTAAAASAQTETTQATMPSETHKDIPVGFTAEGYPYRGSPDAPVTIYEYSDYQCPFCSRYFVQTEPAINESFVRNGEARVVFRDFPLAQLHPNAPAAHVAAWCIAEQGSAAAYWEMHDQLFRTQTVWSNLPDPVPHFVELAQAVGVDLARFNDCVASGAMDAKIQQGLTEGEGLGITGTPSFNFVREATDEAYLLVGAQPYDQFAGMIGALVAGGAPPQAQQPQEQQQQENGEIPFWATADGLAPDPDHPGYDIAGDQYRGNPEAKVVVIEFSDFQCPYCRRHVQETQPTLDATFVDTDQILWVFKHFPLNFHPQAEAAGVAAECAADQGKFWEMHDLLFTNVEQWSISDPAPVFSEFAGQLTLDTEQFAACLTDSAALERVQSDMQAGAPFVQGTPTFIVLYGGEGRIIPGALPLDRFQSALQEVIDGTVQ